MGCPKACTHCAATLRVYLPANRRQARASAEEATSSRAAAANQQAPGFIEAGCWRKIRLCNPGAVQVALL